MEYNIIRSQIKEKHRQNSLILQKIKEFENEFHKINKEIKLLINKFPKCYLCGKNQDPKYMEKATHYDIDNYIDKNEGYSVPELNEFY